MPCLGWTPPPGGADPLAGGREAAPAWQEPTTLDTLVEAGAENCGTWAPEGDTRLREFVVGVVVKYEELRAPERTIAALEEELAGSDARERRLVRHRIACMRAQRQAIRTRLVARLGLGHEADILAVLAEFEAEMDEPHQQAALAAAEASGPPEAGTPGGGGTT